MAILAGMARGGSGVLQRLRSSFDIRYYALLTVIATYGLIVLGGTVRATDSGTACPDWPLCHGEVIPPADVNVWIEFSHRLTASFVGFLIFGLVLAIWRTRRSDRPLWYAAVFLLGALAVQVIVGGITVGTETAAGVVAVHLTIALTLISALIFITARLFRTGTGAASRIEALPLVAAAGVFALVITGVFVSQREAGLAYPDWPLFDGKLTPAGSEAGHLHYAHRVVAGLAGLVLLGLIVQGLRVATNPVVMWGLTATGVLFIAQALLGAANVWLELATSVRILHLALASAVWAVLVFTMAWAYQNGLHLTKGTS
jgi:heme A synthase